MADNSGWGAFRLRRCGRGAPEVVQPGSVAGTPGESELLPEAALDDFRRKLQYGTNDGGKSDDALAAMWCEIKAVGGDFPRYHHLRCRWEGGRNLSHEAAIAEMRQTAPSA